MIDIKCDKRFEGIKPFESKIWLSSPTMHEEELLYVKDAFEKNWKIAAAALLRLRLKKMKRTVCIV